MYPQAHPEASLPDVASQTSRLDDDEAAVLSEIHLIQSKLAQTRHRLSTSRRRRFLPHNPSLLALQRAVAPRPAAAPRVVSVSLRLPRAAPQPLAVDAALPPIAVFTLADAAHCPFVWVGADGPCDHAAAHTAAHTHTHHYAHNHHHHHNHAQNHTHTHAHTHSHSHTRAHAHAHAHARSRADAAFATGGPRSAAPFPGAHGVYAGGAYGVGSGSGLGRSGGGGGGGLPRGARRRQPHPPLRQVHVPLPVDGETMRRFHVFCDRILWRLLHYDYVALDMPGLHTYWEAYRTVNCHFAEAVADVCEDGDLIWVHNYHLMLLPALLRESLWYARIGFFLYTPFPSAELFRILPHRAELLRGVLGADLIGFHSYEYAKQFVASCRRLLGLEATPNEVIANPRTGRTCKVGIYPAGIDVNALRAQVSSKLVQARVDELRARFDGMKLVVGIDRLDDRFTGVTHKLLAFERLLADNPQLVGHVVLVQVALLPNGVDGGASGFGGSYATFGGGGGGGGGGSGGGGGGGGGNKSGGVREGCGSNDAAYRAQRMHLNELVGRINSVFGTWAYSPVHFITSPLDPSELHALMCVGHVSVVTTERDGMGLVPHEWTICQRTGYKGPIVLSEFAGAAQSFSAALHVNPWDIDEVASKIKVALDMGDASRHMRSDVANRFVTSHTAKQWGCNFIDDLENVDSVAPHNALAGLPRLDLISVLQAYLGNALVASRASSSTLLSSSSLAQLNANRLSSLDLQREELAADLRLSLNRSGSISALWSGPATVDTFSAENHITPSQALRGTQARIVVDPAFSAVSPTAAAPRRASLFIVDLEGTLVPLKTAPEIMAPSQQVLSVLRSLLDASPQNHLLITSSRGRQSLAQWFSGLRVFLAAEDGAFFRPPDAGCWSLLFRESSSKDSARSRQSPGNTVHSDEMCLSIKSAIPQNAALFNDSDVSPLNPNVDILADMLSATLGGAADEDNKSKAPALALALAPASATAAPAPARAEPRAEGMDKKQSVSSLASVSTDTSQNSEPSANVAWKAAVLPVMEHFAERTPGAFVEEGDATVTWHYADAEPDFGQWQSRHLSKHLESFVLRGLAISTLSEDGQWIRARPKGVDKTKAVLEAVNWIMKKGDWSGGGGGKDGGERDTERSEVGSSVEFVFCVGDDRADEGMFELFKDKSRLEKAGIGCSTNKMFTCRVGSSRTAASWFLESPAQVVEMLDEIASKLLPTLT